VLSYKEFRVDFARNVIVAEKEMKIDTSSPEATVPWLTYLARQLVSLTEYLRQQTEEKPLQHALQVESRRGHCCRRHYSEGRTVVRSLSEADDP